MNIKISFLLALAIGLGACQSETRSSDSGTAASTEIGEAAISRSVKSQEAKTLLEEQQGIIVLDVRTQKEYEAGHVKDALQIDFYSPDFAKHLQALDPAKPYMVYCAVGGRSGKAVKLMEEMGFKQLYNVSEGYGDLKKAGVPVESRK